MVSKQRVSPFYHDWLTTTDRTTGLLQSDRLVFGMRQIASCRWWRHRSRSHWRTGARRWIPGSSRHKPPWCGTPWAHNLLEARSRPGCQGPQRSCTRTSATTSWKMKSTGKKKNTLSERRRWGKRSEWSKRGQSERHTMRMNHEDGMAHGWVRTQTWANAVWSTSKNEDREKCTLCKKQAQH